MQVNFIVFKKDIGVGIVNGDIQKRYLLLRKQMGISQNTILSFKIWNSLSIF
jgi:hypothetical protein